MCLLHKPIGRRAQSSVTPIHPELSGSDTCTALAITVRGHTPILLLCGRLIEAGHNQNWPLHTYRDETLCLTISSISAGACLEVNAKPTGFISHPAVRTPAPVAPTAKCLVQLHKQAVLAAAAIIMTTDARVEQAKSAPPKLLPRCGPRFSLLNCQSGSEVFTKFANVKSRISWTAERRQQLQEMWDRGDKAPVIAAALGCKAGAINVARVRFGLMPRRIVSGRPKEPDEPDRLFEILIAQLRRDPGLPSRSADAWWLTLAPAHSRLTEINRGNDPGACRSWASSHHYRGHAMRAMRVMGIDPGVRGGVALVLVEPGQAAQLLDAINIPVVGLGAKEWVDVLALRDWIRAQQPQHAVIERAQAMPKQGASSGFKYGRAVGSLETVISGCEVPLTIIEPTFWKKFHGLRGGDKEGSRQRALQLFPAAHALLARKKDHGRGEAALIALSARPNPNSPQRREIAPDGNPATQVAEEKL